jgi:hypothetical protein
VFAQGGDAKRDVLFERDAEFFRALADVFPADAFGKGFVFEPAFYGIHFEIEDALCRPDVSASGEESGELIASVERVLQRGLARNARIVGVGKDGADDFFGVAAFAEDFRALRGMFLVRSVRVVGLALVVEIVQQRGEAPKLFVRAGLSCVSANAGFHREHVLAQTLRLCVFAQQFPSVVPSRHAFGSSGSRDSLAGTVRLTASAIEELERAA